MQVLDEVKKQSLILRLQEGSTDAAYFAAICILTHREFVSSVSYFQIVLETEVALVHRNSQEHQRQSLASLLRFHEYSLYSGFAFTIKLGRGVVLV